MYTRSADIHKTKMAFDAWLSKIIDELVISQRVEVVRALDLCERIAIDAEKFRGVILNLLENALQAFDANQQGRISIETPAEEDRLKISTSDTGQGILEANMKKIFEPLFSTKTFGVGLGLLICEQIVCRHGG